MLRFNIAIRRNQNYFWKTKIYEIWKWSFNQILQISKMQNANYENIDEIKKLFIFSFLIELVILY